ncbi:cytochrome P450 [Absidia repens]|uniref:Cytochrome P450 n=1 Tax=Absidia repens TaxID=90262 RepID=A0A1X2IEV9_9FUNG|nr:cytochrome P450 [Absidia repens]
MEDIKDLVTSLTITGMSVLRSPAARQQVAKMAYFQAKHALSRPAFRKAVLRSVIRLTLVYIAGKYFVYRLFLHPANKLPGPRPDFLIPFMGNVRQLISANAGEVHREWAKKYGNVFRYFSGANQPRILIADPELLKQILTNDEFNFTKAPETKKFLSLFLGDGLLAAEGDVHRYQRKMLNPAFSVGALRGMIPSMVLPTQQLVHQWWQQFSEDGPTSIVVSHDLQLLSLELIGSSGFGLRFDCLRHPEKNALSRAYLDLLSGDSPVGASFAIMFPWALRLPIKRARQVRHDIALLQAEAKAMVEAAAQRKDLHDKKDLLALMMQQVDDESGNVLTTKELQDQCLTFLAAGHETISVTVSWCLHTLAHHQDIQDALRYEIQTAFPDLSPDDEHPADDLIPSYDDFNQLPLLNNVCKESLRYTPSVPLTNRTGTKDFKLHDTSLPKGTCVVICPMVSHFDTRHWGDDADQFVPSRWDRAPANSISPYVYLPFLAGGHQCIGYRFAMIEFKVILALLIKNFRFTPKPGFNVRKGFQVTLRPLPNMTLMMEKVES